MIPEKMQDGGNYAVGGDDKFVKITRKLCGNYAVIFFKVKYFETFRREASKIFKNSTHHYLVYKTELYVDFIYK